MDRFEKVRQIYLDIAKRMKKKIEGKGKIGYSEMVEILEEVKFKRLKDFADITEDDVCMFDIAMRVEEPEMTKDEERLHKIITLAILKTLKEVKEGWIRERYIS